jgi:hypothetical protein
LRVGPLGSVGGHPPSPGGESANKVGRPTGRKVIPRLVRPHDMANAEMSLQILAIEVSGWPGLAAPVTVRLNAERTVLVGKNGAGKSVVLAAMVQGAAVSLTGRRRRHSPSHSMTFRCQVGTPGTVHYTYEYRLSYADDDAPATPGRLPRMKAVWEERCFETEGGSNLWAVKDQKLSLAGTGQEIQVPEGYGLLAISPDNVPLLAKDLPNLLAGFDFVAAGVPRPGGATRSFILLQGTQADDPAPEVALSKPRRRQKQQATEQALVWRARQGDAPAPDRVEQIAEEVVRVHERSPESFEELRRVLGRLGLVHDIRFTRLESPADTPPEAPVFGMLTFDNVNIGLLSDGTLRVIEIILHLLRPINRVLCVEEPETAVHPGLLRRVLSELNAYSGDRQIVVSTHSPYVVNWCEPNDLRLVERVDGVTSVRPLSVAETERIEEYLTDDGLLDEYIFSEEDSDEEEQ